MQNILTQLAAALASLSMIIGVGAFTPTNQLAAAAAPVTASSSDLTGSGTASASSAYSGNPASAAFDNNTTTSGWGNNNAMPSWLEYDLGSAQVATSYTLLRSSLQTGGWSSNSYSPSAWTFQGSNDGSTWTTLDTQTGQIIYLDAAKATYSFSNSTAYRYYRIYITAAVSGGWANITEMEIIGSAGDTTAPSVPAGLSGTAVSSSQINLAWTVSTDNVGVTGYNVYRGGNGLTTVATPPNPPSTNDAGWAGYTSREVISSSQLSATGLTSVRVTFKAGTAGLSLTNAYIGEAGSANAYSFASTPVQLTFNGGSASAAVASNATITSDPVTFTVQPVQNLVVSSYTAGTSDYQYSAGSTGWLNYYKHANDATTVSTSGYTLDGSNYDVGISLVQANSTGSKVGTSATASYSDTGLTASTQYSYTVAAYDAAGNNSAQSSSAGATTLSNGGSTGGGDLTGSGTASASSAYSGNPASAAFDNNTTTSGWGNNNAMPSWLEYDLGSAQVATSYTLLRSSLQTGGWSSNSYSPSAWTFQGSNDGSTWTTLDTQTGQIIYLDAAKATYSFSNSTAYRYYRIYITAAVSGGWANITEMEIIGSAGDTTAPSVPAGLSGTAVSSSQINLAWTVSTDNVGVTGYNVYRGGTKIGTSATNSYSDTGLTASTQYSYTVAAYDAAGNNSAQSSSAGATTLSNGGSTGGGDLTGSGTASASDSYSSGGNPPWYAFDNNTTTNGWGNNGVMPSWLEYDLGSAQVATSYTLLRSSLQSGGWSKNGYSPSAWTFQGSNDGSTWTTLDTQTGQIIYLDAAKATYSFSNSTAYRYYRIYITAAVSGGWVNITEMEIIGSAGGGGTAPVISAIASWNAQTATLVTWTTSVTATSKIVYGTTSAYGSASSSASLVTSHAISLFGLSAGTTYHYAVVSKDGSSSKTSTSTDQTFTAGTTTISYPTVDPWFHGNGVNGALSAFWATGGQPRMNPIQFIPNAGDAATAQADGYTYYGGLDGAAPACIQNDIPNCHNISTAKSWIEGSIDSQIAEGAKYFYVDEPCFDATDFNTSSSDRCSVPYNVAGINALVDYIHAKCPTCKFGYSSSQTPDDMKILMDNGARPDLYQHESYEFWEDQGDPFAALHAAYPSVLRSWLIESIPTFCSNPAFSLDSGKVDMLGLWDIDNSGSWGYPRMEPTQLSIFQYFAATGDKSKYCQQTWTWDPAVSWLPILPGGTGYTKSDPDDPRQTRVSRVDVPLFAHLMRLSRLQRYERLPRHRRVQRVHLHGHGYDTHARLDVTHLQCADHADFWPERGLPRRTRHTYHRLHR